MAEIISYFNISFMYITSHVLYLLFGFFPDLTFYNYLFLSIFGNIFVSVSSFFCQPFCTFYVHFAVFTSWQLISFHFKSSVSTFLVLSQCLLIFLFFVS